LEKRRLRGDLSALCSFPRWGGGEGSAGLCSLVAADEGTAQNSAREVQAGH